MSGKINKRPSSFGSLNIEGEASAEQRYSKIYDIWKKRVIIQRIENLPDNDTRVNGGGLLLL